MHPHAARRLATLAALLVVAASVPIVAGEGRTPIFGPTTISTDGRYIVTRNIGPAASPIITVSSPNVDIDLNGFTLDNSGSPQPVILAPGPVLESLAIRHGTLKGGAVGVDVPFGGMPKVVLEDLRIQSPTGFGIHLVGPLNVAIRGNLINAPTGAGIQIDPFGGSLTTGVIAENSIRDGGGMGMNIQRASALAILNNRVDAVSDNGIAIFGSDGCLLEGNTVEKAGRHGMEIVSSGGNKLYDNVVRGSAFHGVHLDPGSNDNLISRQVASQNGAGLPGGHGLFIEGSKNYVEHSILNTNNGAGLDFSPAAALNTYGRNTARGNAGVAVGPCGALFPPNSCDALAANGNTSDGGNLIPGPPIF